jgi:acetolactate synthase-1/2/3 large subunit
MKMNGADAILRSLEAEGVDVVFGIPGGAILPTYDAFARGTTVRHVLARHEQGAGHMAEGYARASGKVGVAMATSGPGATNLVTAIANAWMDSTPTVFVTGQVRSSLIGTDAFQECDITGITLPIVKHSWLVKDAQELPHVMKAAFHVARTGRCGPVLVDVPRDVQEGELEFEYPDHVDLPGWKPPQRGHPKQIRAAAEVLAAAERPMLYVGGGVLNADAMTELKELAEAARLPVVTTLMAKSAFPEAHELHFGWPGMHGPKWSNYGINKCDVLVAIGARFDDRVTGKLSSFAAGATVIHLDVDSAEIDKLRFADVPVVGPLKPVLRELTREIRPRVEPGRTDAWLEQLRRWRDQFPLRYGTTSELMKPQPVFETLQALTAHRDDVIWATGVGQHQMWAMQYLLCNRPRTFLTSGGLGTMGYGVPAAIGAKAARPDATVVCIDGDGCFQMTQQELATAVSEDLPIVTVIVNNGYLGMVRQWQDMFFEERFSQIELTHALPDYARLAEAYGALGFTVDREEDLVETLAEAIDSARTAVVDARVDPREHCFPMIPAGAAALDLVEFPGDEALAEAAAAAADDFASSEGRPGS